MYLCAFHNIIYTYDTCKRTHIHTHTHTHTHTHAYTYQLRVVVPLRRVANNQTKIRKHAYQQVNKQTNIHKQTNKQTNKHTNKQAS